MLTLLIQWVLDRRPCREAFKDRGSPILSVTLIGYQCRTTYIVAAGVDTKSGFVFCSHCDDFIYDSKLENIHLATTLAAEEKLTKFKSTLVPHVFRIQALITVQFLKSRGNHISVGILMQKKSLLLEM